MKYLTLFLILLAAPARAFVLHPAITNSSSVALTATNEILFVNVNPLLPVLNQSCAAIINSASSNLFAVRYLDGTGFSSSKFGVIGSVLLASNVVTTHVSTNAVSSSPVAQYSANFTTWTDVENVTNSYPTNTAGAFTLTFPPPIANSPCFLRITFSQTNFITLSQFLRATPFTITNSTDSTFGAGAGIICWDTNYFYLSVGSNRWKRVSVSSW
jgi:hypothetical protein